MVNLAMGVRGIMYRLVVTCLHSPYSIIVVYMPGTSIGFSVSSVSFSYLRENTWGLWENMALWVWNNLVADRDLVAGSADYRVMQLYDTVETWF